MIYFCNFKSFTYQTSKRQCLPILCIKDKQHAQFGPNNNSSDLTKKSAWYCKEKVFSSGGILSKMVQFLSHVKQLLFLEGKVSVYTILCQEEKKNMLTLAETFRGNATKTECILMHCSRKSTNNVVSAYFP